jgi:hypothetical protein
VVEPQQRVRGQLGQEPRGRARQGGQVGARERAEHEVEQGPGHGQQGQDGAQEQQRLLLRLPLHHVVHPARQNSRVAAAVQRCDNRVSAQAFYHEEVTS